MLSCPVIIFVGFVDHVPFRLLRLRRYGSINVRFHICRLTLAVVTRYRLQNSKHFYSSYMEHRRRKRRNRLTGRTSILNEPEGAICFNVLNVQFHSNSFIQRCFSLTLWRLNNVFHSLSKIYFHSLLSFSLA